VADDMARREKRMEHCPPQTRYSTGRHWSGGFVDKIELDTAALREENPALQVITSSWHRRGSSHQGHCGESGVGGHPLENKWKVPVAPGKKGDAPTGNFALLFSSGTSQSSLPPGQVDDRYNELPPGSQKDGESGTRDLPSRRNLPAARRILFISNHFPVVYGLSDQGLNLAPDGAGNVLANAQAYQMKAYLLFLIR